MQSKTGKIVIWILEINQYFYSNSRKGIDPCSRAVPSTDYEQPNPPPETTHANEDTNDQYAELDEPQFAGYRNQISN